MSSALKPVLPPSGAQTSAANPPSAPGKPLSASQGMAQHASAPGPYSTGPLGHVPQNLGGLPHPHGSIGLQGTNMATNMTMNTMSNMSQMGGHGNMNQTPPHNMQGAHTSPMKSSTLPSTAAAATVGVAHGRPAPHPYLSGSSALSSPPQEEGTTLPLPASQNSAQLMAVHRAQQNNQNQSQQQHHPDQQQPQQNSPDRFKSQPIQQPQINQQQPSQPQQDQQPPIQSPQIPPQQQQQQPQNQQHAPVQSNGTVSGSTDTTNNKLIVPTPPAVDAKTEITPSAPPAVQNHVTPASNEHEVNNVKQPENSTSPSVSNASVPPQTQASTNSEQKQTAATTPTAEPTAEVSQQQATTTSVKVAAVPKEIPTKPPSIMKLATTPRTTSRKRETKKVSESSKSSTSSPTKTPDGKSPGAQNNRPPDKAKAPRTPSEERKSKRTRTRTQPYQSPLPELALITKLSSSTASPSKAQDEKLIVFYKNEFLAVRNAEGGFYVCQTVQNVYKSTLRIRIRWLSQDKQDKIYIPDFYDTTDFDCILTNLNMERVEKGKYNLPKDELERTENILKRALAVESGEATPSLTEEHPDGLDLSLFRDESQLKKKRKSLKRKSLKRKSTEPLSSGSSSPNNKRTRKTHDKSKPRKISKSPAPKTAIKKNNQSSDRRSTFNSNATTTTDKREGTSKTLRRSDGGRAERAKRRGEAAFPVPAIKTSPVVDQKKARVLAKVAMKTAIPASSMLSQNKKKAGKNTPTGNGKAASTTAIKAGVKSTRSSATASNTVLAASTASASTSSTRRGKKTKK